MWGVDVEGAISLEFFVAAVLAQMLYWPSIVVGSLTGLFAPSWTGVGWLALVAAVIDFAQMLLRFDSFALVVLEENWLFFLDTIYPGAIVHV